MSGDRMKMIAEQLADHISSVEGTDELTRLFDIAGATEAERDQLGYGTQDAV